MKIINSHRTKAQFISVVLGALSSEFGGAVARYKHLSGQIEAAHATEGQIPDEALVLLVEGDDSGDVPETLQLRYPILNALVVRCLNMPYGARAALTQ